LRIVLRWAAVPLQVFGVVVGIDQLALGLHVSLKPSFHLAMTIKPLKRLESSPDIALICSHVI
jgi:hypothetical protein